MPTTGLMPGVHLAVRPDWLARHAEQALEPNLPIIDPHHHFWDRAGDPYLLDDLLADTTSGHKIIATVFIECRSMYHATGEEAFRPVGETEFVNGIAAISASGDYGTTQIAAGIIGHVDLRIGARTREVLAAHIQAGGGRFRGIRHVSAYDEHVRSATVRPPQGMLGQADFRAGFSQLAPLNLTFDSYMFHHQLPELTALARAFPATQIVMNHVGGPIGIGPYAGRRNEIFIEWTASIRELASCPNVFAKLGGMGMRVLGHPFGEGDMPPTSEQLAKSWGPYVETVIAAFGTARCMYESNFPVDKGMASYQVVWNAFKRISAGASADEKADLFRRTAASLYRLDGLAPRRHNR
ncbi:MAG: amidohydrolase [Acetobacteraceae bacterium]|nr:amidohydrolase [Acetobacteraceae bacterium]